MTEEEFMLCKKEIAEIHKAYNDGNKSIKPSFKYIVVLANNDFIVTRNLDVAQEKAIEYGNKNNDFITIYEVVQVYDATYRTKLRYSYRPAYRELKEESDLRDCMHIAWRTRGELLEVCK